jgi:hypothetical protein
MADLDSAVTKIVDSLGLEGGKTDLTNSESDALIARGIELGLLHRSKQGVGAEPLGKAMWFLLDRVRLLQTDPMAYAVAYLLSREKEGVSS